MLFLAGFALMLQVGASNTLIQSMVPDHLRGRAMSVYSMMYIGIGPFGALVAGFAADGLGARVTILSGAVICLLASVVFAFRLPSIRPMARQLIREQQNVPETEILTNLGGSRSFPATARPPERSAVRGTFPRPRD
jgi:MFS family permease